MKSQKLLSYTRRAINDYDMISPGDKIAIGISGGKDSLTLLYAMSKLKKFYPIPFEIEAITVDLGFKDFDTSRLKEYCESLGVNYTVCKTHIGEIVFDYRKEPNPCSLCSRMRKGAFNDCAAELGCNKIAYAHHKDDVIDSFLMSMLYEGAHSHLLSCHSSGEIRCHTHKTSYIRPRRRNKSICTRQRSSSLQEPLSR